MKVVRESINEIKQNASSGLGAIGIGSVGMCKAFIEAQKIDFRLKNTTTLDCKCWIFDEGMRDFKKNVSNLLNYPLSKIGIQYKPAMLSAVVEYFEYLVFPDWRNNGSTFDLHWPSSRVTKMEIYTNEDMGVLYATYLNNESQRKTYFCFRMP